MSQICSLAAPCEPLPFPALTPEGAAGLMAQACFICQCEFRCAVPVLTCCQPPSSSAGAQSSSSRKHSPRRDHRAVPLSVPSNQIRTPVFTASVLAVIWVEFQSWFQCLGFGFFFFDTEVLWGLLSICSDLKKELMTFLMDLANVKAWHPVLP